MRELAFLNPGTNITIIDERDDKEHTFNYEGGIVSFVEFLNANKTRLHPDPIYFKKEKEGVIVEVAVQEGAVHVEKHRIDEIPIYHIILCHGDTEEA